MYVADSPLTSCKVLKLLNFQTSLSLSRGDLRDIHCSATCTICHGVCVGTTALPSLLVTLGLPSGCFLFWRLHLSAPEHKDQDAIHRLASLSTAIFLTLHSCTDMHTG